MKKRPSNHALKDLHVDSVSEDTYVDEEWHLALRSRFICQYIKYLHTISFHYVQMDKSNDKGKVKRK